MCYNKHVIKGDDQTSERVDTMANKNGITIKQGFERAREVFAQMGDTEMVAFFDKRLEQNAKRSTAERKLTPHQIENENIKKALVAEMADNTVYSISEMLSTFKCFPDNMTPNRLSALLSQLRTEGLIKRSEVKGKAYFELGVED